MFRANHAVPCAMKHTPISIIKDDVRSEWMCKADRSKKLVTISPFALSVANVLRWTGPIWVVDRDPVVISATRRMKDHFPRLDLRCACQMDIQDFMGIFVWKGEHKGLGVLDLDLTGSIRTLFPTLMGSVRPLLNAKWHGMVYLTFTERNDGFHGTMERASWLTAKLPQSVKVTSVRPYLSDRWDENARLKRGANMCIIGMKL